MSAFTATCALTIGSWSIDSAADARTELVALECGSAMGSPLPACRITLYVAPPPKQGLLEQAAGAVAGAAAGAPGLAAGAGGEPPFSIQVRGQSVKHDDPVTISLTSGDVSEQVMKAQVASIASSLEVTRIIGASALQRLAATRVSRSFEGRTVKQIVQELAQQASVTPGEVDDGGTYPYFIVHESRSALAHVLDLARREGMDVYADRDDRLVVHKFAKTSPDHTLHYGIDLLELGLRHDRLTSDRVVAYGESPSSSEGSSSWPWILDDASPMTSEVGEGTRSLALSDAALRTKDAADTAAAAIFGAAKDQAVAGRLTLLGRPDIHVGDAVEIRDVPCREVNGLFKVTAVRHRFSKSRGFITTLGVSGLGGADAVGDLLGSVGGALGSLGL